jgi:hypothetical protein
MTQKEIAVECLEKLDIYKPYIRKFRSAAGIPCFFENFGGFYADQEPELWKKIKEVESEYGCLVYAITHEFFEFGDCWSMLCVSKDTEEVTDCLLQNTISRFYAFAYVWNATDDYLSEFGDVVVQSFGGGIRRIG